MKIDDLIEDKKTGELFTITGFNKTHIHFTGYDKSGGIPKENFEESFILIGGEKENE